MNSIQKIDRGGYRTAGNAGKSTIRLFDTFERLELRPSWSRETPFSYLNSSARPDIMRIRSMLENWFHRYPYELQSDWKRRFMDGPDNAAFTELLIYQMLKKMGALDIIPRPNIPNCRRTPHFLANIAGSNVIIEVKDMPVSSDMTNAAFLENPRVLEFINKVDREILLQGVCLDLEFEGNFRNPIRFASFEAFIKRHIKGLDLWEREGVSVHSPTWIFESDDSRIHVTAYRTRNRDQIPDRAISSFGSYRRKNGSCNSGHLSGKSVSRPPCEGGLNYPYIICANLNLGVLDDVAVERTMYGRKNSNYWPGVSIDLQVRCKDHVLWKQGANTRVSAVLLMINSNPFSFWKRKPSLWLNPWAEHQLDLNFFKQRLAIFRMGEVGAYMESDGFCARKLLGLGKAFPATETLSSE